MIVIYLGPILGVIAASTAMLFCYVHCVSVLWKSKVHWYVALSQTLLFSLPGLVLLAATTLSKLNPSQITPWTFYVPTFPIYVIGFFGFNPLVPMYFYTKKDEMYGRFSLFAFGAWIIFAIMTYLIWNDAPIY